MRRLTFNIATVILVSIIFYLCACNNGAPPPVTNPLGDSLQKRSIAEPEPDSGSTLPMPHLTDTGLRTHKGTRQDSMRTELNPYYKGDNSDTGARAIRRLRNTRQEATN